MTHDDDVSVVCMLSAAQRTNAPDLIPQPRWSTEFVSREPKLLLLITTLLSFVCFVFEMNRSTKEILLESDDGNNRYKRLRRSRIALVILLVLCMGPRSHCCACTVYTENADRNCLIRL